MTLDQLAQITLPRISFRQRIEDWLPATLLCPARKPDVDAVGGPIGLRQVLPTSSCLSNPEDTLDKVASARFLSPCTGTDHSTETVRNTLPLPGREANPHMPFPQALFARLGRSTPSAHRHRIVLFGKHFHDDTQTDIELGRPKTLSGLTHIPTFERILRSALSELNKNVPKVLMGTLNYASIATKGSYRPKAIPPKLLMNEQSETDAEQLHPM